MLRGAVLFVAVLTPLAAAQQFTYDPAVIPNQNLWTNGVELADLDGDGDLDILFANGSFYDTNAGFLQQKFYRNDGGTFSGNHGALNVANMNAQMVIAEDFDGDGDKDIMYARMGDWPNPAHTPTLLINQGGAQAGTEGVFTDVSATNLPAKTLASFSLCAGDVDNDGDLDVVITDGGTFGGVATRASLYLNDGSGSFTDATARIPNDLYNAQDVTLFDYDGDFDVDIALSGKGATGKRGRLYVNDGAGFFSIDTALDGVGGTGTYEVEYGDLDADGDWDAAVQSISGFNEGWALNEGNNTAMTESTLPAPNGDDDNEMGLLDYDLDGDLDIFVGSLGAREKAYRNNGNNTFTNVNSIISVNNDDSMDLDFGDLDGDGRIDIVTGNGEGSGFRNKAYMNSGAVDTLAPVVVARRNPASFSDSCAVYLIDVKDQYSEDGFVGCTVTYDWTTTGVGAGSDTGVEATRMGGGLYRAEVPTQAQTASTSVTWTITDEAGNATVDGPHVVTTKAWLDISSGLAGVTGAPILAGTGKLLAGTGGNITMTNAAPSAPAVLFVSLSNTPTPAFGGTIQAFPFLLLVVVVTDGSGTVTLPWTNWTAGIPSGFQFWFQFGVEDVAAIGDVSLSNALEVTTP